MNDQVEQFVSMFDSEDDQYIASIIVSEKLPLIICPSDEMLEHYAVDYMEQPYGIVCAEFPGFMIDSRISLDNARELCDVYGFEYSVISYCQ